MKLFLGDQCWDKLFELPKHVQLRVRDFQRKFRENPRSAAINLEKISSFIDGNLRTARIDDTYRAIIGVAADDIYCLIYIDHHDKAMRWAENKRFDWNQYTSTFQVTNVRVEEVTVSTPVREEPSSPYAQYSDEQLLKIGVPDYQLALVRSIRDMDDLERQEDSLSSDVFENLFYLLDKDTDIENIITEIQAGKEESGGVSINNLRHYVEISNDEDLENVIREGTEKWQIFLHPSQRLLVEKDYKGSVKVTGGGGTGKTVAALHRLKKLAAEGTSKSVLYTTYTKALIKNISGRIKSLGVKIENCDIVNIDKLALTMAKSLRVIPEDASILDYDSHSKRGEDIWTDIVDDNVCSFDADFMMKEYLDVIVYNNVTSLDAYCRQSRTGRLTPVTRKQRKEIWTLVEQYLEIKRDMNAYDRNEVFNLLANYLNDNGIRPYKNVIADEIQDFSNPELRFLRALVEEGPNDLFLVGDPYQRIYNNRKIAFSQVGINVRGNRSKRLKVNYRTTEEIKRAAINLVEGLPFDDFDGEKESLSGYVSLLHGESPRYEVFETKDAEIKSILNYISDCRMAGLNYNDIVLACDTRNSVKIIQNALHRNSIPYYNLSGELGGDSGGVNLSTFHNMKGLEFKVVILADVSKSTYPRKEKPGLDIVEKRNHLLNQRALLYVAITRAIAKVYITGCGEKADL